MKKKGFYVMQRRGTFIPENHTDNQCGIEGVGDYAYQVVCLLSPKLDSMGFCIDHNDLDEAIQSTEVQGSCEEMQRIIYRAVKKELNKKQSKLLAYSCVIYPRHSELVFPASITYLKGRKKYLSLLK